MKLIPARIPQVAAVILLCAPSLAGAEPDVAESGMGQGQASINVRSDVKMEIKGTAGTSTANLEQLTEAVVDQMPNLRACYREVIATRPTTVGGLAVRVTLAAGKAPAKLEFKEIDGPEPELTTCVRKVLEKAPLSKLPRPAAAIATLALSNSRAKGQEVMQERRAIAEKIDPVAQGDGTFAASWITTDRDVSFSVRSKSKEAVEAVTGGLRDRFAGFLDCRRRARKGDLSPGGDIEASLRLARGGEASAKVGKSTVAHERAPICVERTLGKLTFEGAPAGQRVDVTVTFAP
jgi:hypothetical protein